LRKIGIVCRFERPYFWSINYKLIDQLQLINYSQLKTNGMNKYTFTPNGLQRLLVFLYGLPDHELQAEAEALRLNFRAWMILYFEFSPSQILYLEQMEDVLTRYFGTVCGFYVGARWPITSIKEDGAALGRSAGAAERAGDPPVWKIVRSEDVLNPDNARAAGDAEPRVTGQLTIEIVYTSI